MSCTVSNSNSYNKDEIRTTNLPSQSPLAHRVLSFLVGLIKLAPKIREDMKNPLNVDIGYTDMPNSSLPKQETCNNKARQDLTSQSRVKWKKGN